MTLFFDIDGTILDPRSRYYRVHRHCLGNTPAALTEEQYWDLKRARVFEKNILATHYPHVDVHACLKERKRVIESDEFLRFDQLIPGALETLQLLSSKHTIILASLRSHGEPLKKQMEQFGVSTLYKDIRTVASKNDPASEKATLLHDATAGQDWMIGDTEADILAGQSLGLTTCAVLSGIREETFLRSLKPTHVIDSIADLPSLLQ